MTNLSFSPQVRSDRAVISVRGETALAFLHNLLTCDVQSLAVGSAAYGALLSPQGKILHDMFFFNSGEAVLLDCAAAQRDALLQKLTLYKLRAKLEITKRDDLEVAVGTKGYPDPRNAKLGNRFFAAVGSFAQGDGYDAARIELGLADSGQDIGSNILFPHEANFDVFGGVSFSKGCYVGQEVVSRMQHRGTARNRIMPLEFSANAPPRGTEIRGGAVLIGEVLSSVGSKALGLLRTDRLSEATEPLLADGIALKVRQI